MRNKNMIVVVTALVVGVGLLLLVRKPQPHAEAGTTVKPGAVSRPKAEPKAAVKPVTAVEDVGDAAAKKGRRLDRSKAGLGMDEPDGEDVSGVTKRLDELLDAEDYEALLVEARLLKKHPSAKVRSRVAFALQWAELDGLGELTSMLGDPDPEVASEAMDYWKAQLAGVDDSADKAALLSAAVKALGAGMDTATLDSLLSVSNMLDDRDAAPQLVGILDQLEDPRQTASVIETLDSILNTGTAMETKDDVTREYNRWRKEKAEEDARAADVPK